MRGKSYEGKLPKKITRGPEWYCKLCHKRVQDLFAHNNAKHHIPSHVPKSPAR